LARAGDLDLDLELDESESESDAESDSESLLSSFLSNQLCQRVILCGDDQPSAFFAFALGRLSILLVLDSLQSLPLFLLGLQDTIR